MRFRRLLVTVLVVTIVLVLGAYAFRLPPEATTGREDIFWLQSTVPQAVAALAGLLFAGYSLFLGHLRQRDEEDETIRSVTARLRKDQFRLFALLCLVSALAILGSFAALILNGYMSDATRYFHAGATGLGSLAVLLAFLFVVRVTDPDATRQAATKLLKESVPADSSARPDEPPPEKARKPSTRLPDMHDLYYNMKGAFRDNVEYIEQTVMQASHSLGPRVMERMADPHSLAGAALYLRRAGKISTPLYEMIRDFVPIRDALHHGAEMTHDQSLVRLVAKIRQQVEKELATPKHER